MYFVVSEVNSEKKLLHIFAKELQFVWKLQFIRSINVFVCLYFIVYTNYIIQITLW